MLGRLINVIQVTDTLKIDLSLKGSRYKVVVTFGLYLHVRLFPDLLAFWILEKTEVREICVSGTALMTQLMQNFPTKAYIS